MNCIDGREPLLQQRLSPVENICSTTMLDGGQVVPSACLVTSCYSLSSILFFPLQLGRFMLLTLVNIENETGDLHYRSYNFQFLNFLGDDRTRSSRRLYI